MKFQWLKDDLKDNHLLCIATNRSLFFRGTLSPEFEGKRLWQPFPKGEPQEVHGDLVSAQRRCEVLAEELGETLVAQWVD
ncbi:hypothetical protein SAMN05216387_107138 [Nitrosovibrio tenuis]|uniref:Uncharacterized protein n=1 Tax=Nitrosovibrio tenuis TaxID=1233 RepID=A0A1H7NU55_9PROT|nr:hypothetical protein SAMN05216387_107138 [Nitrosovibrio tenuis]